MTQLLTLFLLIFLNSSSFCSESCIEIESKSSLNTGWEMLDPYSYEDSHTSLTGMDIEFIRQILKLSKIDVHFEKASWHQLLEDIRSGNQDIVLGATFSDQRSQYVYFSIPYRFEENSLFVSNAAKKFFNFRDIPELLSEVRLHNLKLGVIKNFVYADQNINSFVNDQANQYLVKKYHSDIEMINDTIRGEISGFLSDRVIASKEILTHKYQNFLEEIRLNVKTPIHLMLSKKTVSLELVDNINKSIKTFLKTDKYKQIVKNYLYPVLLLQIIHSDWFYLLGIIGSICFGLSAIIIATKENSTFFGAILLGIIPSISGAIMRDVIIDSGPAEIILTPYYIYYNLITCIIGFVTINLLAFYNSKFNEDTFLHYILDKILEFTDILGQSAFIIIGVAIAVMYKIDPIELWGPFFAVLTAHGGCAIRDMLRHKHESLCFSNRFNIELSLIWAMVFSLLLKNNSYNPNPDFIKYSVLLVVFSSILSRSLCNYFNISNPRFKLF